MPDGYHTIHTTPMNSDGAEWAGVTISELGLELSFGRNETKYGNQVYVTISTDNMRADEVNDDGTPIMMVHLNDGDLYDSERS